MNFNPDLIIKFQQNLRMAQIHSSGGVNEDNFRKVREYMYHSLRALEQSWIENEHDGAILVDDFEEENEYLPNMAERVAEKLKNV